ncbi:MAG: hypothetical protein JNM69_23330 [Archangium sp.]|nr:hypothetical protein [Archangium sp.]
MLLLVVVAGCRRSPPPPLECVTCHASQVERLTRSTHARGQAVASARAVPEGSVAEFEVRHHDGGVVVQWSGGGGRAHFTIGVEPISQLAVEVNGRLQVPPIGWLADGGWVRVPTPEGDAFDWRTPAFNWNASCAPCHATNFRLGLNDAGAIESSWSALSVSCRACHADEAGHAKWLAEGKPPSNAAGFSFSLKQRSAFSFPDGGAIAKTTPTPNVQLEVCAACHSRRRALTDDGQTSVNFFDRFEPGLLTEGVYSPAGEVVDEVYETGSFLMSRMERAGVRCSDCHDAHSGALRAEGNALCARCHRLEVFDVASHHRHPGSKCIDCHMPPTTFLGVDVRHDHSLRRPTAAVCARCHAEKGQLPLRTDGAAFEAAFAERVDGPARLRELINDTNTSAFERASALALLGGSSTSADDWTRYGIARGLSLLPPAERVRLGRPLLDDPRRAIRVQAARALGERTAELDEAERVNGLRGESWLNRGELETGLRADPTYVPLLINLADRQRERAIELLTPPASRPGPWQTSAAYALGLAHWRAKNVEAAHAAFTVAATDGTAAHLVAWCLSERQLHGREAGWRTWRLALNQHPGMTALLDLGDAWSRDEHDDVIRAEIGRERLRFEPVKRVSPEH